MHHGRGDISYYLYFKLLTNMKKADFKTIIVKDIEGNDVVFDIQKQLGNQLYMQGHDIEECELGKRLYFAEGEVELTDKERETIKRAVQGYSFILRSAIEDMLK